MSRKPAPSARNCPAGKGNLSDPVSTIGRLGVSLLGLSLTAGPPNAGKVALLLERYLARLDDEPFLIVPNRSDVDRVERDLLRRAGGRAAAERSRGVARRARLRLRLRGPDRGRVGAARGALRPRRGAGLAAVRAGARRVPVAAPHGGRPRGARRRAHAGARAAVRRVRGAGARTPRARALRGA